MNDKISLKVVAATDNEIYLAENEELGFYVISLDDTHEIELEDTLRGEFHGHGSLFYSVKNVTQGRDVKICLENWECSLETAIECMLNFLREPTGIQAGSKRFNSHTPTIIADLIDEIKGPDYRRYKY